MKKNILVFEFFNCNPHLETALELVKKHVDCGDNVTFIFAGHDTLFQEGLSLTAKSAGYLTKLPEKKGVEAINAQGLTFIPRVNITQVEYSRPAKFSNLQELLGFSFGSFPAGLGVVSSLVSILGDSDPPLRTHQPLIKSMLDSCISVYEFAKQQIKLLKPDLIYTFNGRFCNSRGLFHAARDMGVEIRLHERGSSFGKYIANPFMPHDLIEIQNQITVAWETAKNCDKVSVACSFFENQRNRSSTSWYTFLDGQEIGKLPAIDVGKKVVTYFSSSDDEFVAVGDCYKWIRWANQLEALKAVVDICSSNDSVHLFIRVHPNLRSKAEAERTRWSKFGSFPNVHVITHDSEIDTYALMEKSDLVITSGSTVGIEAVYWGKPSICLGPSMYSQLGATYEPNNHEELKDLIMSDLPVHERDRALPYGLYMATFGSDYKYYEADGFYSGRFLGKMIQRKSLLWRLARKANLTS